MLRANHQIRAKEVFVIDSSGKPMGVMKLPDALAAARKQGLDLVEVAPNANPPVCRILDYGRYRYEKEKRERDSKKKVAASKLKELQLHLNIHPHDYQIKLRQAESFLCKGMKVKLNMLLRGRENLHQDLALSFMQKVRQDLAHVGTADDDPRASGRSIWLTLNPLPEQKRVRKYTLEESGANEAGSSPGS
ncbi:translation initiation factor IF-3 [Candidatus Methylacidithermus pantelleriae]|uniref:translation initiation factor IF-3 n=1 Tax=Candidatus Methylacidithermus pantelleriae TaxID=2744239 RepID=UPI001F1641DE|nr:translation initiation factor IF-3 [Candidatus Methylacidithermus pantelleriae]